MPGEWIRTYPNGLSQSEHYHSYWNGYKLHAWPWRGGWFQWLVVADPEGRFSIRSGEARSLLEAQKSAKACASSLAPGNFTTTLLPSETILLEANKKVGA